MIDRTVLAALLATALLAPTAAFAQQGATPAVSREQALEIARKEGMTKLEEIELDDGRTWEIEGDQANGRDIEVDIDASTGKIIKLEKD